MGGHLFFIRSLPSSGLLGARPVLSAVLGLSLYSLTGIVWYCYLRPGLYDPVLAVGVPIYGVWLTSTAWRSCVSSDWMMFLGGILFMFSDCVIGFNMYHAAVTYSQVWIMSTYYAAIFLITLSTVREGRESIKTE